MNRNGSDNCEMGATNNKSKVTIDVHPDTEKSTLAWQKLRGKQNQSAVVDLLPLDTPVYPDKVRFVCVSDTHSKIHLLPEPGIPNGDVLLHAGDFTTCGSQSEVEGFNSFLGELPHRYKIVIAGNHELSFEDTVIFHHSLKGRDKNKGPAYMKALLTNCIYLQDSATVVHGIKIYGAPWQPEFCGWAFNVPRGQALLDKWNLIQDDVDVLMTHGPPIGYGDRCRSGDYVGCVELLATIQKRVKPKYHVFGHIHEGYGVTTDGATIYINASNLNVNYRPVNHPVIFDIDLPAGFTKIH